MAKVVDCFEPTGKFPGLVCGPGKTHQEFVDECDVNRIMARALKTGMIPTRSDMSRYGDFSSVGDFREAQGGV